MITYYCPRCWQRVQELDRSCPHCQAAISELLDERSFEEKLIAALGHSLPSVQVRSAWLLGRLRATAAVDALLALVQGPADVYTKAAAVEALGRIEDPRTRPLLEALARTGAVILRQPAREALRRLAGADVPQ